MSVAEELHEMHEHAEHAHGNAALQRVSVTMAILAVAVAFVTVLSHRAHTREIIEQSRLSDGWAFYQSKSTRRQTAQVFSDLLGVVSVREGTGAAELNVRYQAEVSRLQAESESILEKNHELEEDVERQERRASRFDLGEAILEAAIVVTSVTLLTKRPIFWRLGLVLAGIGVLCAVSTLTIR